jgi:DNA-directed RNA polymerase subunit RPC12/RpoP
MTETYLEKRACLKRAKSLLASGDDAALRYACLELRYCMERITYDKLRAYAARLPPEVLARWQPPQAVEALVELEEDADQDYNLAVALESSPGVPSGPFTMVGHHRALKVSWLKSAYHALGSVLHVPHATDGRSRKLDNPAALRTRVTKIIEYLEPVVASTLTATLAKTVEFRCGLCRRQVVANAKAARKRGWVVCLYPDCQAQHEVKEDEKNDLWFTVNDTSFTCTGCKTEMVFPERRIALGREFVCPNCGLKHQVMARVWRYAALP